MTNLYFDSLCTVYIVTRILYFFSHFSCFGQLHKVPICVNTIILFLSVQDSSIAPFRSPLKSEQLLNFDSVFRAQHSLLPFLIRCLFSDVKRLDPDLNPSDMRYPDSAQLDMIKFDIPPGCGTLVRPLFS